MVQGVECMPSKHEALSLKKKKSVLRETDRDRESHYVSQISKNVQEQRMYTHTHTHTALNPSFLIIGSIFSAREK
jgi:hypothetical protein